MKSQAPSNKSQTNTKSQAPNSKRFGFWNFGHWCLFGNWDLGFRISPPRGVTLLFVVLIVAALLSTALGIFDAVFGQLRLAGEITDSFRALYAADQGIEKLLYDDRVANAVPGCPGSSPCSYGPTTISLGQDRCVTLRLTRTSGRNTTVVATGEYRCGTGELTVRRAIRVQYQK